MTKRKPSRFVDEPNLKRFRTEIKTLAQHEQVQNLQHQFDEKSQTAPKSILPKLSRKEKRKEARLEKKSRKNAYSRGMPIPTKEEVDKAKEDVILKAKDEKKKKRLAEVKKKQKRKKARQKKRAEESKVEEKKVVDMWDDKEIKNLEKKLGLDKRKNKNTLPQSFVADGLDYLLDVVDSEKLQSMSETLQLEGADSDEDMAEFTGLGGESESDDAAEGRDDDFDMDSDNDFDAAEEDDDVGDDDDDEEQDEYEESDSESSSGSDTETKISKKAVKSVEKTGGKNDRTKDSEVKTKAAKSKVEIGTAGTKSGEVDSKKKEKWEELADKLKEITERKMKEKQDRDKLKEKKKVSFNDEELVQENVTESEDDDDESGDYSDDEIRSNFDEDFGDDDFGEDLGNEGEGINAIDSETGASSSAKSSGGNLKLLAQSERSDGLKEDIYGRLRDSAGNIVQDNKPVGHGGLAAAGSSPGAYIPPARRLQLKGTMDEKRKAQMEKLEKQLKGLINRASENNMQSISSQIEELYLSNSRADVSETLVQLISSACISPVVTPDRLSMELMMLVAILHGNVGSEVGAVFLQQFVKQFDSLLQQEGYGSGKHIDNVIILLAHLYNFKVVHAVLIFDILKILTDRFQERDIELVLVLLRHVGFSLRKDSAAELKKLILTVQAKAASDQAKALTDQSRVRFMLDIVLAIRNNNMRKIPNYDPEHLDHLRKVIRGFIRGGHFGDNQLHIGLSDLLRAEEKGKWWLVGSAWSGKQDDTTQQDTSGAGSVLGQMKVSSKLQELARKQRMNTELRRNIFFIIMTSEDYLDAFEKLLRLGVKSNQQQEIVLVIVDCCVQEKKYNPFYAHLSQKLCEHHRTFQMSHQFTIWDRLKMVGSLSESRRSNLSQLLTHLFATSALSLSILKAVPFGTLEKAMVRLLKQIMTDLLLDHPVNIVEAVFTRIAQLDKLKQLHEGLRLFLRHFLLGTKKSELNVVLVERVELVDRLLSRGKSHVLL